MDFVTEIAYKFFVSEYHVHHLHMRDEHAGQRVFTHIS